MVTWPTGDAENAGQDNAGSVHHQRRWVWERVTNDVNWRLRCFFLHRPTIHYSSLFIVLSSVKYTNWLVCGSFLGPPVFVLHFPVLHFAVLHFPVLQIPALHFPALPSCPAFSGPHISFHCSTFVLHFPVLHFQTTRPMMSLVANGDRLRLWVCWKPKRLAKFN